MTNENNTSMYQDISRNAVCPCGSGKRFKHCHGDSSNQQGQNHSVIAEVKSNNIFNENELFCAIDGKAYDLKNDQTLFVAKDSEARISLNPVSLLVMQELESFATYREHFANCSNKLQINEADFCNMINVLDQQNLLITDNSIIKELKQTVDRVSLDFAGICIRTCESPSFLKRILDSQIRRKNNIGAFEKIYVFDDSSTQQAQNENKQIIKRASEEIEVFYHGLEWQHKFVNSLIKEFPENKETLEKMLLPQAEVLFSGGRLINLALLFFAGKCFLNFDDDFVLDDARVHPEHKGSNIKINSKIDWIYEGFISQEHVEQSGAPLESDPISLHKKVLGLSLSNFLNSQEENIFSNVDLSETSHQTLEHIKADSFFITSGNGWFGTPGKRNARFIFSKTYKNTTAPWKNAESYNELLDGGYCWDAMSSMQIMTNGVSNPAGINNMKILAPTLSTSQGEDTLLCLISNILYPNSLHLGFPWALSHFRHPKKWREATFNESLPIQLSVLIFNFVSTVEFPTNSKASDKIEMISVSLLNISSLPIDQFKSKILSIWYDSCTRAISKLNERLVSLEENDAACKGEIQTIIKNDINHLLADKLPNIEDAVGDTDAEKIRWLQKELKNYANGMRIWANLWEFCAKKE